MKLNLRLKEAKKEKELSKIYMMLAAYPIILIITAALSQYIGMAMSITIYIVYLAYIVFRLLKVANIDLEY